MLVFLTYSLFTGYYSEACKWDQGGGSYDSMSVVPVVSLKHSLQMECSSKYIPVATSTIGAEASEYNVWTIK